MKFFCISSVFHPKCVRNTKRSRSPFFIVFCFLRSADCRDTLSAVVAPEAYRGCDNSCGWIRCMNHLSTAYVNGYVCTTAPYNQITWLHIAVGYR